MRQHLMAVTAAAILGCGAASAAETGAAPAYDILFRTGTLDAVSREAELVYAREVTNTLFPEAEARDSGTVTLRFDAEGEDGGDAILEFGQGDKHRGIGRFPASVGNPMIMYFVESVARDMAETAGGSPFYIRNRIKEALTRPAEEKPGQVAFAGGKVAAVTVTLHPFADDPNRGRMRGFADLALSVTMSDDVPGWYHTLAAEVPGAGTGGPVYATTLRLEGVEGAR